MATADGVHGGAAPLPRSEPSGRSALGPTAALVLIAGITCALIAQGGFYAAAQAPLGVAVAAALALTVARPARAAVDPVTVAALTLSGWALLRGLATQQPASGLRPALLLAGFAATLVVTRRLERDARRLLLRGLLLAGVLVAALGWWGVVWHHPPLALTNDGVWRATSTLTYANAAAAVLTPLTLVAASRLVRAPRDPVAALTTTVLLTGTLATLSRGGTLALLTGAVVLVVLHGARRTADALVAAVAGAAVAVGTLSPSMPLGSTVHPPLPVLGLAGGLGLSAALAVNRRRRAAGWTVAALVATGLVVAVTGPLSGAVSDVAAWRATPSSPARVDAARAALTLTTEHPLTGVGPGDGWVRWNEPTGATAVMRYVHDEYLQTLVELGVPGLLLLLGLLAAAAVLLRRALRNAPTDGLVVGVTAALAAAAVHGAFDFVWHIPVVPVTGAALLGLAIGSGDESATGAGRDREEGVR